MSPFLPQKALKTISLVYEYRIGALQEKFFLKKFNIKKIFLRNF